jgi:hypothetical protein
MDTSSVVGNTFLLNMDTVASGMMSVDYMTGDTASSMETGHASANHSWSKEVLS